MSELKAIIPERETGSASEERARGDAWRLRAETAEDKLAELDVPCVWTVDEDNWLATSCGSAFENKPGPFCPECRHPIEVRT